MVKFLKKLREKVGTKPKSSRENYEAQFKVARSDDVKARMQLAKSTQTGKEILYYMAENDTDLGVRKALAKNKSLPVQASRFLAVDRSVDVRLALAGRLVDLLPSLSEDKHSQLYAFAVDALGTLALDEVLKIRIALSSTLKDHAHTPPQVAGQLARDLERDVSEPILKFCTALSDDDLLDILKSYSEPWVVNAIAGRQALSGEVSEAVIDVEDEPAGTTLICNDGAAIGAQLLQKIVEKSREFKSWQKPTAMRKNLPSELATELASFADNAVRDILVSRSDFDQETIDEVSAVFQRRLAFMSGSEEGKTPQQRVQDMLKAGKLNEEVISDAMAARDYEFMHHAIAYLAKTDVGTVATVFDMKVAKPLVSLCWKAGLSMRLALQMQKEIGHVQPKDLVYPKDGTDYPLTAADMNWQLEFLGIDPVG